VNTARLDQVLTAISRVRLAVVGDYFLDRYGRGPMEGTSRETGRRVLRLRTHAFSPGGTGNVAANAAALGAKVLAIGVVGQDQYADLYRRDLAQRGIDATGLLADPTRLTCSFEKFLVERPGRPDFEVRLDVDNQTPVSAGVEERLCDALDALSGRIDGLVVADYEEYGHGTITAPVLRRLTRLAVSAPVPCLVMSRTRTMDFLPLIPVQNEYEIVTQSGVARGDIFDDFPDEAVARGAAAFFARPTAPPMLFVTRGQRGLSLFLPDGRHRLIQTTPAPGPVDTVGAGDTVLAALAAALAAGVEPVEAAYLANAAAYVTVQKLGTTGAAAPDEVRRAFEEMREREPPMNADERG
jgi:rfaE bifunctional protein kinase chain/domain